MYNPSTLCQLWYWTILWSMLNGACSFWRPFSADNWKRNFRLEFHQVSTCHSATFALHRHGVGQAEQNIIIKATVKANQASAKCLTYLLWLPEARSKRRQSNLSFRWDAALDWQVTKTESLNQRREEATCWVQHNNAWVAAVINISENRTSVTIQYPFWDHKALRSVGNVQHAFKLWLKGEHPWQLAVWENLKKSKK